jgi:hypothetical protein
MLTDVIDFRMCRGALLLQLLDGYATRYSEMLDGRSDLMPVSELAGGARIRHIFQDIYVKGLDELNPSRCACQLLKNTTQCFVLGSKYPVELVIVPATFFCERLLG